MIPKQLYLQDEGQKKLRTGIKNFSAAVKSTLGPAGNTVLLESEHVIGGILATKDGVTVARNIRFLDPVEDMAAVLMRQAAEKTAGVAGDGTTTSVVLTEAILDAYDKYTRKPEPEFGTEELSTYGWLKYFFSFGVIDARKWTYTQSEIDNGRRFGPSFFKSNFVQLNDSEGYILPSPIEITRGLQALCDEMVIELEKASIPVTGDMLKHVATISANNDPGLGGLIAEVFEGTDIVTVKDSTNSETYTEIVKGLKIDKGYVSRYFITDHKKQECVLQNPCVLLYDQEIQNLNGLGAILAEMIKNDRSLLIVGKLGREALHTMNLNVQQGNIKCAVVTPPDFGARKSEKMCDLANVLGAKFYSEDTGDDLQLVTVEGLGRAKSVTITENMTVIEPLEDEETKIRAAETVLAIRTQLEDKTSELEKEPYESRLEAISGSYGVIYVGASTSIEQKEIKDRVDDAVCAIRAAKKEGVLPGGGVGLLEAHARSGKRRLSDECTRIMTDVVETPIRQMLLNAGHSDIDGVLGGIGKSDFGTGYNIKTGKYGDMLEMGIIDPTMVTKSALINAISVATTILGTSCIVTNVRDIQKT